MSVTIVSILVAVGVMLLLAVVMGWILGWANVAFRVEVDPKIEKLIEVLPGANCGACGFAGCSEYAAQLVMGNAKPGACTQCGKEANTLIAQILGCAVVETLPYKAVVHCSANEHQRLGRQNYAGEKTCVAANLVSGIQDCTYGCLGFGDCMRACPNDAISIVDGLARIRYHQCVGCRMCETTCPRHIISIIPFRKSQILAVACSNQEKGPEVKAVCRVGCIGCGSCQRNSSEMFMMSENLPTIDYEHYQDGDVLGMIVNKCPAKMLIYVGEPTEEDIKATEHEEMDEIINPKPRTTMDQFHPDGTHATVNSEQWEAPPRRKN
ncbi:MAG: RnfABCDGE type electron transport complex subunit B [Thermoguttaceae bacterium]|nr:RnfABCDGE type electron transport complex subunit B [Thermoguttaceae bacterium]